MEIQKEARYLKRNSQTRQEKNYTDQIFMDFGPIASCFSVELDFKNLQAMTRLEPMLLDSR